MISEEFWRGKSVFVTGHTGFKGSWLSLWLAKLGANVTGYALPPPTDPSLFDLSGVSSSIKSVIGDVRDLQALTEVLCACQPEIIFHLAAQPIVRDSYKNPVETYAINVMGTAHLLQAIRECFSKSPGTVKAVINVTTDKVYENQETLVGYREGDRLGGFDPYSNSKACSELVTSAFRNSFFPLDRMNEHGVAIATARAGNVIGGGDWAVDRLVPDCVRALLAGQEIRLRNPGSIRPWQHVLEPLAGYLLLAEQLCENGVDYADGWNFGPADSDLATVEEVVKLLCERWGAGQGYIIEKGVQPHEAQILKLDCSKAVIRLGWKPRWDLKMAIEAIVQWTKAFQQGSPVAQVCLQQIADYESGGV